MNIYKELFSNSFGNDDLIIMGLNSVKTKNNENLFLIQWQFLTINWI